MQTYAKLKEAQFKELKFKEAIEKKQIECELGENIKRKHLTATSYLGEAEHALKGFKSQRKDEARELIR